MFRLLFTSVLVNTASVHFFLIVIELGIFIERL